MEKRCFGLGINLRFLLFNKRKLVFFFLGLKTTPLVEVEEASVPRSTQNTLANP